jgi:feruloyl esterase
MIARILLAIVVLLPAAAATCDGLSKLSLPDTTIFTAELVSGGSFTPPGAPKPIDKLPSFCRVAGTIRPSKDSDIRFEVWMPVSGWNGKFFGVGNGGFAGAISYAGLAGAIRENYAAASTDTGHQAGGQDATWALKHPEKIVDYGHRAIHETALKGKAVVKMFYGDAPKRSYFSSCSNGGRQALMEAQRYPEDYDGIIAGAPANYWTYLLSMAASNVVATMKDPASYIPASKLPAIQAAALAACDAHDGVKDRIIENPAQCRFDPSGLLCKGQESDACLTAPQLTALQQLYGGLRDKNGKTVFPGYPMGGEAEQGGWGPWITGPEPGKAFMYAFSTQFFKNMVYSNPDWDFRTFDPVRDTQTADEKFARILNSNDPDLKRFRDRGGKLILYHGWSDAAIPAYNLVDYYRSVERKTGPPTSFVRLYMVPGMQHCGGGSGANFFGQFGPGKTAPESNIQTALERWVEDGVAPGPITAMKFKEGMNQASGVAKTHPLCPYPQVAQYKGSGSTDDAANFTCVAK